MYKLLIYNVGDTIPRATWTAAGSTQALEMVQKALKEDGCERVVVMLGATRLFAVDCEGNRTP